MRNYIELLKNIIENGEERADRTGVGTIEIPSASLEFDLRKGFPLLTTKKMYAKGIIHELLWFISGSTNIKYLVDNGVNIWNKNAYDYYVKGGGKLNYYDFIFNLRGANSKLGDLGDVYGKQWRNKDGIDQLQNLIDLIKIEPNSRRLMVDAWDVKEISNMALPPCHYRFIIYHHNDGTLDLKWNQRSVDSFLGLPFNIASYALLLHMIAVVTDKKVGTLRCDLDNVHIYNNHLDQVYAQITRNPCKLPKLIIKQNRSNIDDFIYDDLKISMYRSHEPLKAEMAV